jgi:hypothetical protein
MNLTGVVGVWRERERERERERLALSIGSDWEGSI